MSRARAEAQEVAVGRGGGHGAQLEIKLAKNEVQDKKELHRDFIHAGTSILGHFGALESCTEKADGPASNRFLSI
jgi:hypothetical protein